MAATVTVKDPACFSKLADQILHLPQLLAGNSDIASCPAVHNQSTKLLKNSGP
ncbi:hypothetical protein KIN20_009977 [Parelaphostrongylus tenuis]|uniref:Uncharacterized protein n=1 Tax=Parelaphostrongylus tenuis TaxID=148309 RepID=A0AAD5M770_PARTN|nr:hypothetical protein KIN20_009977 [Parelaphostrongylus tenuis]